MLISVRLERQYGSYRSSGCEFTTQKTSESQAFGSLRVYDVLVGKQLVDTVIFSASFLPFIPDQNVYYRNRASCIPYRTRVVIAVSCLYKIAQDCVVTLRSLPASARSRQMNGFRPSRVRVRGGLNEANEVRVSDVAAGDSIYVNKDWCMRVADLVKGSGFHEPIH